MCVGVWIARVSFMNCYFDKLFFLKRLLIDFVGQGIRSFMEKLCRGRFNLTAYLSDFSIYFCNLLHSTALFFLRQFFFPPPIQGPVRLALLHAKGLVRLSYLIAFIQPSKSQSTMLLFAYGAVSNFAPLARNPVLTLRADGRSANDGR